MLYLSGNPVSTQAVQTLAVTCAALGAGMLTIASILLALMTRGADMVGDKKFPAKDIRSALQCALVTSVPFFLGSILSVWALLTGDYAVENGVTYISGAGEVFTGEAFLFFVFGNLFTLSTGWWLYRIMKVLHSPTENKVATVHPSSPLHKEGSIAIASENLSPMKKER